MRARTILRAAVLAALVFQLSASAAEAAFCRSGTSEATVGCPSSNETAATFTTFSGCRAEAAAPTRHAPGTDPCSLCAFCLAPYVEASLPSLVPDGHVERVAPADSIALYDAPSFSLLRPPIA